MPRRTTSAPKHRAERKPSGFGRHLKLVAISSGVATAVTGLTVGAGMALNSGDLDAQDIAALTAAAGSSQDLAQVQAELDAERSAAVSRSDRRTSVDRTKATLLKQVAQSGGQVTKTKDLGGGDPRTIAQAMLGEFGFGSDQFGCLDSLWTRESGWNPYADNPSSSAYGIPQALPGSKMSSAGPDWATNPATQIRWGLGYIAARYGSPCGAWGHSQSSGWY